MGDSPGQSIEARLRPEGDGPGYRCEACGALPSQRVTLRIYDWQRELCAVCAQRLAVAVQEALHETMKGHYHAHRD